MPNNKLLDNELAKGALVEKPKKLWFGYPHKYYWYTELALFAVNAGVLLPNIFWNETYAAMELVPAVFMAITVALVFTLIGFFLKMMAVIMVVAPVVSFMRKKSHDDIVSQLMKDLPIHLVLLVFLFFFMIIFN